MLKQNKFNLRTGMIVLFCVILAVMCRQISTPNLFVQSVLSILRPMIYIGIYFAWAVSFQRRILHGATRRYLTGIAALMIFWMCVRTCKYMTPDELATILRAEWYLYYVPLLLIPAMCLFLALYIRRPENYVIPKRTYLLYIPVLSLLALVLTNDLHQLVFRFAEGAVWTDKTYSYNIGYYIVIIWDIGCALAALTIILLKCRIPRSRKVVWVPFITFGLCVVYGILCYLGSSVWQVLSGDMTSGFCLLLAMILESCIWCGLIPSNTGHDELFANVGLAAQITDNDYCVCYSQKGLDILPVETMRRTEVSSVMLENGIRLSGTSICGGHVLWREDVSKLQTVLEELADTREQLLDANLVEEENLNAKRRITQLSIKNQLYDKIQQQTAGQIVLLSNLIDRYSVCSSEKEKQELWGKMVVIGAYLKRRSNLIFITDQNPVISVKELTFCFEESMRGLLLCGVECSFHCNQEVKLPGIMAMQIYDFFEAVIEGTLDGMSVLVSHLGVQEEEIIFTMSVECLKNPENIVKRYGADIEKDFDGAWLITMKLQMGGA